MKQKELPRRVPWGEKMRGLLEFIQNHTVNLWKPRGREWVIYKSPDQRFRITVEQQQSSFDNPEAYRAKGYPPGLACWGLGRSDYFQEQGIDIDAEDDLFFAKQLEETLWQHTSYMDRRYIIAILMRMQLEDDLIRVRYGFTNFKPDPVASDEEIGYNLRNPNGPSN